MRRYVAPQTRFTCLVVAFELSPLFPLSGSSLLSACLSFLTMHGKFKAGWLKRTKERRKREGGREESFVTIRYLGGGGRTPTFDGPPPSEWAKRRCQFCRVTSSIFVPKFSLISVCLTNWIGVSGAEIQSMVCPSKCTRAPCNSCAVRFCHHGEFLRNEDEFLRLFSSLLHSCKGSSCRHGWTLNSHILFRRT